MNLSGAFEAANSAADTILSTLFGSKKVNFNMAAILTAMPALGSLLGTVFVS